MLAFETDLLEYPDIFEGSKVMDGLVAELIDGAAAEMAIVDEHGGAVEAVDYMKAALVDSHRERIRRIESGEQIVVGRQPLRGRRALAARRGRRRRHPHRRPGASRPSSATRSSRGARARDQAAVDAALAELAAAAAGDAEHHARDDRGRPRGRDDRRVGRGRCATAFGEFRAPTGVGEAAAGAAAEDLDALREEVERVGDALGRRPKILVGKPGLDGHSNGAEQIAVRARDVGMDVVYEGIRLTPSQIAASALQEGVHVVGLSIL